MRKLILTFALVALFLTAYGQDTRARRVFSDTITTSVVRSDSIGTRVMKSDSVGARVMRSDIATFGSAAVSSFTTDSIIVRHANINNAWDTLNVARYVQCFVYRNTVTEIEYFCPNRYTSDDGNPAEGNCKWFAVRKEFTGLWSDCLKFNIE
jgi:hypothetical protein